MIGNGESDKDNYKRRKAENVTTFISDNCENGNDAEVIHVTVCIWNMGEYWQNVTLFQISYVMVWKDLVKAKWLSLVDRLAGSATFINSNTTGKYIFWLAYNW